MVQAWGYWLLDMYLIGNMLDYYSQDTILGNAQQ